MAKKQSADETTLKLIEEVNRRKQEIADSERANCKTNMSFSYQEGSSNVLPLHVQKIDVLIKIAAFLLSSEAAYKSAAIELGIEDYPLFKWNGFTVQEWIHDIKLKVTKLQIDSKKTKLEKLEQRLNSIMSPELRQKMELDAIREELDL